MNDRYKDLTIITLTGPSCSGKTSVEKVLEEQHGVGRCISHTSRQPRNGEINGIDYHFVDKEDFNEGVGFLEFVRFDGNFYGLHEYELSRLLSLGHNIVTVVVEPYGARQIKQWCVDRGVSCLQVFINTNPTVRFERLMARYAEEKHHCLAGAQQFLVEKYDRRIKTMVDELSWSLSDLRIENQISNGLDMLDIYYNAHVEGNTPEYLAEKIMGFVQ